MQEESVENTSAHQEQMNLVFANRSKEDVIYPLTVREIAQAQKLDASLKKFNDQYSTQLVENTEVLCKDGKMVIPAALQHHAVSWYATIYSTLGTQDLKKLFVLQCTGKV